VNVLTKKIIQRGIFTMIELAKNIQKADFEENKRMNIENFIKVL
jgi:hypothetical protein